MNWRCLAGWYSMYADWEEGRSCSPSATDLVRHYLNVTPHTDAALEQIDQWSDDLWNFAETGATLEEQWNFLDALINVDDDASFVCDGCGRVGNVEDGITGDGGECPDEECSGTVHRLLEES